MSFGEHFWRSLPEAQNDHANPGATAMQRRISMLKGFNYPLTAKGKSTLNPPPPWYYSADFLNIEFWFDPAAVAAVLPPRLDPDPAAKRHATHSSMTDSSAERMRNMWIRPVTSIESAFC
jgi:hypothetical protein